MHPSLFAAALLLGAALPRLALAADTTLTVTDAYVRLVPPSAPTSAAFMVIGNAGNAERQLIGAQSPAARAVELHSHSSEMGVMKMRQVPSIGIKAKGRAELRPGSYHIMLIDIRPALKEGDFIPITLTFDDGSSLRIMAPVRKLQTTLPDETAIKHQGMTH
jgi:copper(I)-binding protein